MDNKNVKLYGMGSDTKLLHYLRSKHNDRFSKIDAFCDLIDRMTEQGNCRKADTKEGSMPLCYGEFTGSISELANDWHWHRATVRTFLDGLESQGFLTKRLDGRNYIFRLRTSSGVLVPVANGDALRTVAYFLLHHWDEFNLTADDLAKYFENYEALALDSYTGTDYASDVAELKTQTLIEAFCHLEFAATKPDQLTYDVVQLVRQTFTASSPWSWSKWMCALQMLDLALLAKSDASTKVLAPDGSQAMGLTSDLSKHDVALLEQLHKLLNPAAEGCQDSNSDHSTDE